MAGKIVTFASRQPLAYVSERRIEQRDFLKDRVAHGPPYQRGELMRRLAEIAEQVAESEAAP